jgi:hypothetical protein
MLDRIRPRAVLVAYDLALIARQALKLPAFGKYDQTTSARFVVARRKAVQLYNQNSLLTTYPGAVGGKIGWTSAAAATYVGMATRHGITLIVTLGTSSQTRVTIHKNRQPGAQKPGRFPGTVAWISSARHRVHCTLIGTPALRPPAPFIPRVEPRSRKRRPKSQPARLSTYVHNIFRYLFSAHFRNRRVKSCFVIFGHLRAQRDRAPRLRRMIVLGQPFPSRRA